MDDFTLGRLLRYGYIFINLSFLILIVALGYYTRFAADDFGFVYLGNLRGALNDTIQLYHDPTKPAPPVINILESLICTPQVLSGSDSV